MRFRLLLSSFAVLSFSLAAHASSLIGDSVDVRYLFPDTSTTFQDFGTQTVTNGLTDTVEGELSITFSANQLTIKNLTGDTDAPAAFSGFDVALLSGLPFTTVTFDPSSNAVFEAGSSISFTGSDVRLNIAGTCASGCTPGAAIVLDVTNGTAVTPEPSSLALLGTGILGVIGVARKRFA